MVLTDGWGYFVWLFARGRGWGGSGVSLVGGAPGGEEPRVRLCGLRVEAETQQGERPGPRLGKPFSCPSRKEKVERKMGEAAARWATRRQGRGEEGKEEK